MSGMTSERLLQIDARARDGMASRYDVTDLIAAYREALAVIAAYEEDADVALVEKAEAVEAESQAADLVIAEKDAEIKRLRDEGVVRRRTAERALTLAARCMRDERAARAQVDAVQSLIDPSRGMAAVVGFMGRLFHEDDIRRALATAETAPEPCRCAGHYMACDKACPDFWLPDVPMSPNKGHAETAPEEGP